MSADITGWPAQWMTTVIRARKAEAERDRYADALRTIVDHDVSPDESGTYDAQSMQEIASRALGGSRPEASARAYLGGDDETEATECQ